MYPKAIEIPSEVDEKRSQRFASLFKSTTLGVKARVFIICFELFGFILTNSSTLFMDAVATIIDCASSMLLIFCIYMASKPPDRNHPLGHGRYEPIGGLIIGAVLAAIGLILFIQQAVGILQPHETVIINLWSFLFPLVAIFILEFCYRYLIKVAKQEESTALYAEAYHYRIDALTSLLAVVALSIAAYSPDNSLLIDHLGALSIDFLMIILGVMAARHNFHQLTDKAPSKKFFQTVVNAAKKVDGVLETEKVVIQQYGPDAHVDIDVEVAPCMRVDAAHIIAQKVRAEIQKAWPSVRDVTVHIEPYYPQDH